MTDNKLKRVSEKDFDKKEKRERYRRTKNS